MAEKLIGESALTTWWYLKVFVDAGVITSESETNNLMYVLCPEYQRQNMDNQGVYGAEESTHEMVKGIPDTQIDMFKQFLGK